MTEDNNEAQVNDQLKTIIDRIIRLEDEKKDLGTDIREIYAEAKANGYDPKILRKTVKFVKNLPEEKQQFAETETYLSALGIKL